MAYENNQLEGLFRTVGKPYGSWKKNSDSENLQPLFRIKEQRNEDGRFWVKAKFARNVPVKEWILYPCYGTHTINLLG